MSIVWEGRPERPVTVDVSMRFRGNMRYIWNDVDSSIYIRPFSVDPSAMPAEIDFEYGGLGPTPGIYEIDGDTLTLCWGRTRPERFESPEDPRTALFVFRRVEEEDDE